MNIELLDEETPPTDGPREARRRSTLRAYDHQGNWLLPWAVVLVLLMVASVADFILIRTLMLILMPFSSESSLLSTPNLVAAAVVVLSTAAMFGAGLALAHHQDAQSEESVATRRRPIVVWVIVFGWAALGITLVAVRFIAVDSGVVLGDVERDRLLAVLMSGLYLATGLLAITDGYLVARPFGARVRHARQHLKRLEKESAHLDAKIAELVGQIRRHEEVAKSPGTDPTAIQDDYATQRSAIQDLSMALQRFAQVEIARRVGTEEAVEAAAAHDSEPATGSNAEEWDEEEPA